MKEKTDVWQGTLALMVLRTLQTLGPLHGYGIARRIETTSGDRLSLNYGTLYPALLKLEQEGSSPPSGACRKTTGARNSTASREPGGVSSRRTLGNGSRRRTSSPDSSRPARRSRERAPGMAAASRRNLRSRPAGAGARRRDGIPPPDAHRRQRPKRNDRRRGAPRRADPARGARTDEGERARPERNPLPRKRRSGRPLRRAHAPQEPRVHGRRRAHARARDRREHGPFFRRQRGPDQPASLSRRREARDAPREQAEFRDRLAPLPGLPGLAEGEPHVLGDGCRAPHEFHPDRPRRSGADPGTLRDVGLLSDPRSEARDRTTVRGGRGRDRRAAGRARRRRPLAAQVRGRRGRRRQDARPGRERVHDRRGDSRPGST